MSGTQHLLDEPNYTSRAETVIGFKTGINKSPISDQALYIWDI